MDVAAEAGLLLQNVSGGPAKDFIVDANGNDAGWFDPFRDVTEASGLVRRGWGAGVCIADYDNDGFRDVYVTAFGADALWRNGGDGRFVDVTKRAGVEDTKWSTGCAFGDYDLDGDLDLYVANYVRFDESRIPGRGTTGACRFMPTDVFCGPNRLPGEPDDLRGQRLGSQPLLPQQWRRHLRRRGAAGGRGGERRRPGAGRHGRGWAI